MEQTDIIGVDQISSFDDLLSDLNEVKNQIKNTGAGTSTSDFIDENIIFQYLEEASDDPNRVETVCKRVATGASGENLKHKKRKIDDSVTPQDVGPSRSKERPDPVVDNLNPDLKSTRLRSDSVLDCLIEMFPQLPVGYLKNKARNRSFEDVQDLVESILAEHRGMHDDRGVLNGGTKNFNNDSSIALDETNLGDEVADTSIIDEGSDTVTPQSTSGDDVGENFKTLLNIFPDVDPEFLLRQSQSIGPDPVKLEAFITASMENKSSFPSKKEYNLRKTKREEQLKIKLLTVHDFLQMFEDPHSHFSDISSTVSELYKEHAIFQLRTAFPFLHHTHIAKALEESNHHYVPALKKIQNLPPTRGKQKQSLVPARPSEMDLTFLKEYVYSKLESKIRRHQEKLEENHNMAVEEARKSGGLFDCQCCFDGDCLLTEVAMCEEGHMFCKDCLRRGAAVQIGDQKSHISCLLNCGSFFPLAVLQTYLSPNIFSRLLQKQQLEEVASAGLEDLVQCPACNFATIMPDPLDKVVRCRNPECGKESCRLCQEDNHVPLSCDEVEKDSDVADRVKLENAMSEAMIRTCVACKKKFFKEEGCNMMKCTCGAKMCYICRQPVKGHKHFDGPNACPIESDNVNLHKYEVMEAANKTKKEMNKTVKFDPTESIDMPPEGFDPQDDPYETGWNHQVTNGGNPFQGVNPQVMNGGNPYQGFIPQGMNGGNPYQGFNPQVMNGGNPYQGFNPQVMNGGNPFQGFNPQVMDGGNPYQGFNPQVMNGGNPYNANEDNGEDDYDDYSDDDSDDD